MYYFFNEYRPGCYAFCLVDLWFSAAVGVLYGLTPYRVGYCIAQNVVLISGFVVQIAAAAYFLPFRWLHMLIAYIVMAVLGLAASISMIVGQTTYDNLALDVACGFTFFYAIAGLGKTLLDTALTVASLPRSAEKALALVARDQPTMDEHEMLPARVYRPPPAKKPVLIAPEEPLLEADPEPEPEPEPQKPPEPPKFEEDDWDPTVIAGYHNPLAQEYGDRTIDTVHTIGKKKRGNKKAFDKFQTPVEREILPVHHSDDDDDDDDDDEGMSPMEPEMELEVDSSSSNDSSTHSDDEDML